MAFKAIKYQEQAVNRLQDLLDDAWTDYENSCEKVAAGQRSEPRRSAVYLAALTGAGKTVMAGRLVEKILTQPDAAILWLSDSPSLNLQTRDKLAQIVEPDRLKVIDKVGINQRMEPGYVYFLNPQKLGKQKEGSEGEKDMLARWRFLLDGYTDPTLRLYVFQDEAHRGIKKQAKSKRNADDSLSKDPIILSVIQASSEHLAGAEPAPVVLGISATPDRFKNGMEKLHRHVSGHVVDPADIQDSGLIKRSLDFRIPTIDGATDRTNRAAQLSMLDTAVSALKLFEDSWDIYHERESSKQGYNEQRVVPLLLFQVPDSIEDDELGEWVRHINDAWDRHFGHQLPDGAVAHVLQGGSTIQAGDFTLPYCPPNEVQDRTAIRVLIAKLAVTTGWDCPRAEVLYSLRGGEDDTYIAQLIGRMVRMPLAIRSLSADLDRLNVGKVILPYFNQQGVSDVVGTVKGDGVGSAPEPDMVELVENPEIVEAHGRAPFEIVSKLKKKPAPKSSSNPVALMDRLSVMLAGDKFPGVEPDPNKSSREALFALLDDYVAAHPEDVAAAAAQLGVEEQVSTLAKNWATSSELTSQTTTVELTPLQRRYKAERLVGTMPGQLGTGYVKHLQRGGMEFTAARDRAASVASLDEPVRLVTDAAREQCRSWLVLVEQALTADAVLPPEEQKIPEARQIEYRGRMAEFGDPIETRVGVLGPRVISFGRKGDRFPHGWAKHLFVEDGGDGLFRLDVSPSSWEKRVLDREVGRQEVVAWYRNPGSGSEHTLQVPWRDGGAWRSAHPDFVFVEEAGEQLRPSVVDPHDPDRDGLARLRGLALFAEEYGDDYVRFWSVGNVASGESSLRSLDLLDASVRAAIAAEGADAHKIYQDHGKAYL